MNPIDITGENWKVTLPFGKKDHPTEFLASDFPTLKNQYFYIKDNAIIFNAPCNGVTTSGSKYPRSELREMTKKTTKASWDFSKGVHSMTFTAACNHLPKNKPQVVMGQIHDSKDDVVEIRLTGTHLEAIHNKTVFGTLQTNYQLGSFVEINIAAENKQVKVSCNGKTVSFKPSSTKGCYFKIGCYVQSNASKGDGSDYGEVALSKLKVEHR